MRAAVIASMKNGLDHWAYRELQVLASHGIDIDLFPTKRAVGLYNPPDNWRVHRWTPLAVILWQPYFFLRRPASYLRLLWEAVRFRAVVDVMIGWHFARHMAEIDVIYSIFGDHKLFIGYFCKQILGRPLAVTLHAYELYLNPNPRLLVHALQACDQVITVTEHNKELLGQRYGVDAAKVEVVRCVVDTDEYRPASKFVILIVAFFDERKGHEALFKAVRQLARDDIEVWVVGDGDGRKEVVDVRALARQLGLESQVAFFGKLRGAALKAVYRTCDVFCLPCRESGLGVSEGFPTVLMEAMAFGKPVITTRHVEIPRVVPEVLVDENDVDGLASAIDSLMQSADLRRRLGDNNRQIAERLFTTRNAQRTAAILTTLAEKSRA